MLNNRTVKTLSFIEELRVLTLEQLRDTESMLIDTILRHYDELEAISSLIGEQVVLYNNAIQADTFKLQCVRSEIDYQMKSTLIESCKGIFKNMFDNDDNEWGLV